MRSRVLSGVPAAKRKSGVIEAEVSTAVRKPNSMVRSKSEKKRQQLARTRNDKQKARSIKSDKHQEIRDSPPPRDREIRESGSNESIITVTAARPSRNTKTGFVITRIENEKTIVSKISENGLFSGTDLSVGDEILRVNGIACSGRPTKEIAGLITSAVGLITLQVKRPGTSAAGREDKSRVVESEYSCDNDPKDNPKESRKPLMKSLFKGNSGKREKDSGSMLNPFSRRKDKHSKTSLNRAYSLNERQKSVRFEDPSKKKSSRKVKKSSQVKSQQSKKQVEGILRQTSTLGRVTNGREGGNASSEVRTERQAKSPRVAGQSGCLTWSLGPCYMVEGMFPSHDKDDSNKNSRSVQMATPTGDSTTSPKAHDITSRGQRSFAALDDLFSLGLFVDQKRFRGESEQASVSL